MSWSLNMDILQQHNDRGLHFFFRNADLCSLTRIAELIQIFNGSCEEFFHGFCQKRLFFFFSDGWCYNPSETHLQLHNFGTSHTLQGTITYPLKKKSIFSRWFSEIPRLVGYVSVPWRVHPGRLTWNLQITHFSVFLRVGNSSETASISIFFATFRFKTPPFKAAALRAAKGGWGWGVLIRGRRNPGPYNQRSKMEPPVTRWRWILRRDVLGRAPGGNNAIRWTFVLGMGVVDKC